ncbi:hypothetical protein SCHPADRAFT_566127 [Schizopora paradoxa]|uniref:Uncharacterized protein n=1 Tax=Schizopora paradoxa TaxID=27342 RepID=A0A0H2RJ41_9AGAM|nr:hypothetical protein SCHPADRAFT_566127 [Schizopora paradoxa]
MSSDSIDVSCDKPVPVGGSSSSADQPKASDTASLTVEYRYPELPENEDFETYRKTDPVFKGVLEKVRPLNSTPGILGALTADERKRQRSRFIFQTWPRDPKGEDLTNRDKPLGKMTTNMLPVWGATLYDFYHIHRSTGWGTLASGSGSMLANWMRQKGELHAMNLIEQAEKLEPIPERMKPYDITEFIELVEVEVHRKTLGRSMKVDKSQKEKAGVPCFFCN